MAKQTKKQLKQENKNLRAKLKDLTGAYRSARASCTLLQEQNEELLEDLENERGATQFQERLTNLAEQSNGLITRIAEGISEIAEQGRPDVKVEQSIIAPGGIRPDTVLMDPYGKVARSTNEAGLAAATYCNFSLCGVSALVWAQVIQEALDAREAQKAEVFQRWDVMPGAVAEARFNAGTKLLSHLIHTLNLPQNPDQSQASEAGSPSSNPLIGPLTSELR